jgi:SnoaL-like domain
MRISGDMTNGTETMTKSTTALTRQEVESFVAEWYRNLDVHAIVDTVAAMVTDDVEFQLPEGPVIGVDPFREWYEGVIRIFFDEVHTVERVVVSWTDRRALVQVRINWQARRWRPPAARSQWIGFNIDQDWEVLRSETTGRPLIARYVVNEVRPMPGSPPL